MGPAEGGTCRGWCEGGAPPSMPFSNAKGSVCSLLGLLWGLQKGNGPPFSLFYFLFYMVRLRRPLGGVVTRSVPAGRAGHRPCSQGSPLRHPRLRAEATLRGSLPFACCLDSAHGINPTRFPRAGSEAASGGREGGGVWGRPSRRAGGAGRPQLRGAEPLRPSSGWPSPRDVFFRKGITMCFCQKVSSVTSVIVIAFPWHCQTPGPENSLN